MGGSGPSGTALFRWPAAEPRTLYGLGEQRAHRGHARVSFRSSRCRRWPRYPHRPPSAVEAFFAADQRGPSIEPASARRSPPARHALPRVPLRAGRAPRASHSAEATWCPSERPSVSHAGRRCAGPMECRCPSHARSRPRDRITPRSTRRARPAGRCPALRPIGRAAGAAARCEAACGGGGRHQPPWYPMGARIGRWRARR